MEPVSEESFAVTHPFLDPAPLSAAHFAAIEDRVARLLSTEQDVVITQGEALLHAPSRGDGVPPARAKPRAWGRRGRRGRNRLPRRSRRDTLPP